MPRKSWVSKRVCRKKGCEKDIYNTDTEDYRYCPRCREQLSGHDSGTIVRHFGVAQEEF